jgi:hypothetical protein
MKKKKQLLPNQNQNGKHCDEKFANFVVFLGRKIWLFFLPKKEKKENMW